MRLTTADARMGSCQPASDRVPGGGVLGIGKRAPRRAHPVVVAGLVMTGLVSSAARVGGAASEGDGRREQAESVVRCASGQPVVTNRSGAKAAEAGSLRAQGATGDPGSHAKEMHAGPLTFDFGGQARLRFEHDDGFTLQGYEPGVSDDLLLERVRLDLSARLRKGPRLFLQLQDAHAFLTQLRDANFPTSNPIEDTLDIRQLHAEWLLFG
jgi:hypothetical protein